MINDDDGLFRRCSASNESSSFTAGERSSRGVDVVFEFGLLTTRGAAFFCVLVARDVLYLSDRLNCLQITSADKFTEKSGCFGCLVHCDGNAVETYNLS